jgi:Mrp family chromosome partitioning ATPase
MTSKRLRRIIRSRWWVLALSTLLAALAATLITLSRNNAIPEYEAVAAITFNRLLGEVDDFGAQERLSGAEVIAEGANAVELSSGIDPLSPSVRAEVVAHSTSLRLLFIGRGETAGEASAVAVGLRDRYLAAQTLDISEDLADRIAMTSARLDIVIAAIAAARPPPDINDIETTSRIRELQAEVDAFASLYGALTAELLNPRILPRPTDTILADRDAASEGLRAAQDELLNIQFALGSVSGRDLGVALLRAEEAQLRTTLDGYVAQSIIEEPIGVVDAVVVYDADIPPTPLPLAIVVALSIGLLVGVAGLVIIDRIRQPLWEITELEPRYRLPETVARPPIRGENATKPWYDTAPQGQRKAGIQQLRSHVEGLRGFSSGLVVGVASLRGLSSHAHELAADLASGLTHSGSWALLIDSDYGNPSHLAEYRRQKFELDEVLTDPHRTLGETAQRADLVGDLVGIGIRNSSGDAADVLAKPAFASMLDSALEFYDVVIVACPPADSPSYHVLSQRLDAMILVAVAGDPTPADVQNALHTLEDRRSMPAGVVLLRARLAPTTRSTDEAQQSQSVISTSPNDEREWHWSKTPNVTPGEAAFTETHQEPSNPPSPSRHKAGEQRRTAGPQDANTAAIADTSTSDGGEQAMGIEGAAKRAPLKRAEAKSLVDDPDAVGSPWSHRDATG